MAKLRILVLNPFEITAATTIRMEQLCRVLAKEHKILFVSYGPKAGRFTREGIEYILYKKTLPSPLFHFGQMWLKFLSAMREDYDLIYVSKPLPWALFPGLAARLLRGKRLLLDWDEHEHAIISRISKNRLYIWIIDGIERCGVKRSDGLVVVSPYLAKLAAQWGCKKEKVALIQNGVNPEKFKPKSNREEMRKKYQLEGKVVMFLGSLRPQFDIDLVIKAMPLVRKEISSAKLVIVGDGSERKSLEEMADGLGIREFTIFLGHQPHELIPSFVNMADVVVAPNRLNEMNLSRSPVKLAEYMQIGTPIVANAVGLAEDMLRGGAGQLVYKETPNDMAEKIISLLKDRKLAKSISEKAKERVNRLYTWERLGSTLNDFIGKRFAHLVSEKER